MATEHVETLSIGAGQAGLAAGYHLQRRGRPFLIIDVGDRVGDGWRRQWGSMRLYSPAAYDTLPGLPFPAPRWTYPGKDAVAGFARHLSNIFAKLGVATHTVAAAYAYDHGLTR